MKNIHKHGDFDIVYLVKQAAINEELRYSLRSVEQNFPHRSVWFYGGCPDGIEPDHHCYVDQEAIDGPKWYKTTAMLEMACRNEEITKNFWLFNDDFFIMEPAPATVWNWYNGTMADRILEIEDRNGDGIRSSYSNLLRDTRRILISEGLPTKNYAVHTPMLIDRWKALETIKKFQGCPMFRCLYGNMYDVGNVDEPDVKIRSIFEEWDGRSWCMSTSDTMFRDGIAGQYIRDRFTRASRFEDIK